MRQPGKSEPSLPGRRYVSFHLNEAIGKEVIRWLGDLNIFLGCPHNHLLMQWDRSDILLDHLDRLADHRITFGRIRLDTNLFDQFIQSWVAIAAVVDLPSLPIARAQQGIKHVVRVVGGRRPAQQIEIGVVVRSVDLVEELGLGLAFRSTLMPTRASIDTIAVQICSSIT